MLEMFSIYALLSSIYIGKIFSENILDFALRFCPALLTLSTLGDDATHKGSYHFYLCCVTQGSLGNGTAHFEKCKQ